MTRTARHRSLGPSESGGYKVTHYPGGYDDYAYQSPFRAIQLITDDSYGAPVIDSYFNSERIERQSTPYNGKCPPEQALFPYEVVNLHGNYEGGYLPSHLPTNTMSDGEAAAAAVSRTNPSRPVVSPLGWAQNLKDLPGMLKDVGKLIRSPKRLLSPKEIANQHLGALFGWLPLFDDVKKLIEFGSYVNKRSDEIRRLYSASGLKRRISLGNDNKHEQHTYPTLSGGPSVDVDTAITTNETLWATVRWKPDMVPGFHSPSDSERLALARRVASGMTVEGAIQGAWDLIPWSWMVDWFANVGDYITMSSNTIPASPVSVCVMRKKETTVTFKPLSKPVWLQGGGGRTLYVTKNRYVGGAALEASLPYLDGRRLSVLGSLFVQRFSR